MPETQVDLLLNSLVNAPLKDDRALMEFPFFSLQKQPRMEPMVYDNGKVQIRIAPSEKGLATIWDKDVLIYALSLVNERIERGVAVDREVRFAAHDLLKVTGRGTGKRSYELLLDALDRLRNTSIQTSIVAGDERERRGFGWIELWRVVERKTTTGRTIMGAIEITLNAWMFRALVKDRRVLTINPAYFDLGSGIGRRLYELARKHAGDQPLWRIGIDRLASKVGTTQGARFARRDLLRVIAEDAIPDYSMAIEIDAGGRKSIVFSPRRGL